MSTEPNFDVIVVGGSYAGLSAAMPLARARRRVAVVDTGLRRNRFAAASHGFITQDGVAPGVIAGIAREQVCAYPGVSWFEAEAVSAAGAADAFAVTLADGRVLGGRRLVLASGVVDELPALPGLAERWGRHVFHCPYCHGFELNEGEIGVFASGSMALHQAAMLPHWGRVTLFGDGRFSPSAEERGMLESRGVTIEPSPAVALEEAATLVLADGRRRPLAGLFVQSRTRVASPLAAQLGCAFEEGPMGAFVKVDAQQATSVPGVFACGDLAKPAGSVPLAVGDGAQAGFATHRSLLFPG